MPRNGGRAFRWMAGDAERTVALAQVAVHPPLAGDVVAIVGAGQRGALERAELGLDEIEPARLDRGEHRDDPLLAQDGEQPPVVVDPAEVVEHDVEAPARVAGAQAAEGLDHFDDPLAPPEDPAERVGCTS